MARIISFIGIYGSLILSKTSDIEILQWSFIALAIFWLGRYIYFINRIKK